MLKKTLATAAVAATAVGVAGMAAAPAMAIGDDEGPTTISGNGNKRATGNITTGGYMSPNIGLVNGSLNEICVSVPPNLDLQNVVQVIAIPIGVQDLLTSKNSQNCTENSVQIDGDDPLSHFLSNIPVLSGNGAGNS
ncbi:rodlin [Streptomyces hainanensis]|uniref:RdlA protein n=1 Tax=Streptomyces hainanensis TaxID=402648 RepID=A0A4R4SIL1_9ACTN|nr:rodlin [Streptomyces hainanensis]TDC63351.1 RdlA protein [Streptomyces hainanensis]